MIATLARRMTAEFLGTLFLLAAVVGSGIMGDRLSSGRRIPLQAFARWMFRVSSCSRLPAH
ncbi:MAG TPA: hypothetical protein VF126_12300 [Acidobacteriaceae bacterium]